MQLTGALCARLGAGLVAAAAAVLVSVSVVLPGLAHTVPELAVAVLVFGAATGTLNVAVNSVGIGVEAAGDRPILPGLHAGFSFGGLGGAAFGGVASGLGPVAPHLLVLGGLGLLLAAVVAPVLVAGDTDRPVRAAAPRPEPARTGSRGLIVVLGLIAGCTAYGEGAITDWGALHLRETLLATPAVAAAGYAGFSLAMACGRLLGGRLIRALGPTQVLVHGSVLAALGMLAAAFAPVTVVALIGFALVGLGLANVFPLAIARAGATGGSSGVALASSVGYTGLLGGPPVIGLLIGALGLPAAMATVSVLAALAAGLSLYVAPERDALSDRVSDAVAAGRGWAVAGLTPALVRYGPSVRRYADDLALLGPATGRDLDRRLTPEGALAGV